MLYSCEISKKRKEMRKIREMKVVRTST